MAVVTFEPRKQVIIHEYTKYDKAEEMVNSMTVGAPPGSVAGPLQWVDGVLMKFNVMPLNSELVVKELLAGRLHWDHVSFAPLEKCAAIRTDNVTMTVIDVSSNPTFKAIAKFIKDTWLKT
jgi:hypothetical protein